MIVVALWFLPMLGLIPIGSALTTAMILAALFIAKMITFVVLVLFLRMQRGILRDVASLLMSATLTLVALMSTGFAEFQQDSWLMLVALLIFTDILSYLILLSAGAARPKGED